MSEQQEIHMVLLSNEPERVYPAFMLALGAVAMDVKVNVYCAMKGLDVVKKGAAEKIQLPGAPPLSQLIRDAISNGVRVCACAPSKEMLEQMGVTKETVEEGVELEDVVVFLRSALPAAKKGGLVFFV